jgi:hypothetical protein
MMHFGKFLTLRTACLALTTFFLGALCSPAGEPGFRRFADTISPDGNYVLAWGWGMAEQPEQLQEWAPGQDTLGDSVTNYLVDSVRGRVLTIIPERDHFRTSDGHSKGFSGLAVAWSEDSQHALAIYEDRWSDSAILWVRPRTRTFINVLAPLVQAYRDLLAQKEKLKEAGEIGFSRPALLPGGILVINARARPRVNQTRDYCFRLKFLITTEGEKAKCRLVSGRKIPSPDDDNDDAVEKELNEAYQKLKAGLSETNRVTLKERQLQWLKQREALGEGVDPILFTQLRTSYLRARAGD